MQGESLKQVARSLGQSHPRVKQHTSQSLLRSRSTLLAAAKTSLGVTASVDHAFAISGRYPEDRRLGALNHVDRKP